MFPQGSQFIEEFWYRPDNLNEAEDIACGLIDNNSLGQNQDLAEEQKALSPQNDDASKQFVYVEIRSKWIYVNVSYIYWNYMEDIWQLVRCTVFLLTGIDLSKLKKSLNNNLNQTSRFDYHTEDTRDSKSTRPVVEPSHLSQSIPLGRTVSQLKQSAVSHVMDIRPNRFSEDGNKVYDIPIKRKSNYNETEKQKALSPQYDDVYKKLLHMDIGSKRNSVKVNYTDGIYKVARKTELSRYPSLAFNEDTAFLLPEKDLNKLNKTNLNDKLNKRFDDHIEDTRDIKSTCPVVEPSYLSQSIPLGRAGSQFEQSDASPVMDINRSSEVKIRSDGDDIPIRRESIYLDEPYDFYSENETEETVSDLESSENNEAPNSRSKESQMRSPEEDGAQYDGEEPTDSDDDFELMKIFAWLDKKEWAKSYYDFDDGVVIHVEPEELEASKQLLAEEFPNFHKFNVIATEPGVCKYCADPKEEDEETNNNQKPNAQYPAQTINTQATETHSLEAPSDTQTKAAPDGLAEGASCPEEITPASQTSETHVEYSQDKSSSKPMSQYVVSLQPGYTITSDEHQSLFSGRVGSKGLTVAHIGPSDIIHHYGNSKQNKIGILKKFLVLDVSYTHRGQTTSVRTTADLGLLNLETNCLVRNIICDKSNKTFRLKLCKGDIERGIPLRIIDQNGDEKHGKLTSTRFTLKRKKVALGEVDDRNREVHSMLQIQNENSAISGKGDSGRLVTSLPKEGSDELFVYGIVTHLYQHEQLSSTIANRLSDVLHAIDRSDENAGLRDTTSNNIEFTDNDI